MIFKRYWYSLYICYVIDHYRNSFSVLIMYVAQSINFQIMSRPLEKSKQWYFHNATLFLEWFIEVKTGYQFVLCSVNTGFIIFILLLFCRTQKIPQRKKIYINILKFTIEKSKYIIGFYVLLVCCLIHVYPISSLFTWSKKRLG